MNRVRLAVCALSLPLLACGGGAAADRHAAEVETARNGAPDSAERQAAESRLQAALEREDDGAAVEELEVRLNQVGWDGQSVDDRLEVVARVPFENPAEQRRERRVRESESDVAALELQAVAVEVRARRCDDALRAALWDEAAAQDTALRDRAEPLRDWLEARSGSGLDDAISSYDVRLTLDTLLLETDPGPPPRAQRPSTLPPLTVGPAGALATDPAVVRELVRQHNPAPASRRAAANRYEQIAARERSRHRIHLGFLELTAEPLRVDRGPQWVSGQVAVVVPWPGLHSAAAREFELLGRAELDDAQALEDRMVVVALSALDTLTAAQGRTAEHVVLLETASQGEAVADRWLADRRGTPDDVLDLYRRVLAARRAVLASRALAGDAACTLLSTTGLTVGEWPRR